MAKSKLVNAATNLCSYSLLTICYASSTIGTHSQSYIQSSSCASSSRKPSPFDDEVFEPQFSEEEEAFTAGIKNLRILDNVQGKLDKEAKRIMALGRKRFTPNVHTALHYSNHIKKFSSAINIVTVFSEEKHRSSKNYITKTNHNKPCRTLIEIECRRQTI